MAVKTVPASATTKTLHVWHYTNIFITTVVIIITHTHTPV